MTTGADSGRDRAVLAAITIAAAALRLFRLDAQSMWTDELLSVHAWTTPPGVSFAVKLLWDVHGPLYSLFMHFWSAVSTAPAWLRLPSAAAGTAAVPLVHAWLLPIGGRRVARYAALFLAVSPFALYYAQEVRFYSFLLLASILALIVYRRFVETPSIRRGALLGLSLLAACLCHFSAGFLCLGLLVHLAVTGRLRGQALGAAALAGLIVLAGISPWIYREAQFLRTISVVNVQTIPVEERYRGELTLSAWAYPYSLYAFSVGYSFGPGLRDLHRIEGAGAVFAAHRWAILTVVFLFGGLLASGIARARRGPLTLFLSIAGAAFASILLLTVLNVKIFNVRYLTSAFPVFVALLAYGAPRRAGAVAAGLVCACMLVSDAQYFLMPRYWRDDIRGAARIVEDAGREGDLVLLPGVKDVFDFYYEGPADSRGLYPGYPGTDELAGEVRDRLSAGGRVWLVRTRTWETDPGDAFLEALEGAGVSARRDSLPGVEVLRFDRETARGGG
ncbi:MAG: glycosyltransferase family 39 protein [Candidatus Krumholzibacteriota bacterium]|nr:glycosyltransferase family 39 protein [Candidatus Krumholzibacteriota bacterium]